MVGELLDVPADEVDARTVDHVVRVAVAGDALVDVLPPLLDERVPHVQEAVVLPRVLPQRAQEAALLQLVGDREDLGLREGAVAPLGEEVDPADGGVLFVVGANHLADGGVLEAAGELFDGSPLDEPQLALPGVARVDGVLGREDYLPEQRGQPHQRLPLELLHRLAPRQHADVVLLQQSCLKVRGQCFEDLFFLIGIIYLLNGVLIEKIGSNFMFY